MQLSAPDFEASAFIAGGGDDLQPLLRLSQFLPDRPVQLDGRQRAARMFINATYERDVPVEPDMAALNQRLENLDRWYCTGALRLVRGPTPLRRRDIEAWALPPPAGLFGRFDRVAYQAAFDGFLPSACELLFERGLWGERRLLRVIYMRAEALATLWALSHGGRIAPRVLVSIQTGPLEEVDGPLDRLLGRFTGAKPQLWLRGRQEGGSQPERYEDRMELHRPPVHMPIPAGRWDFWDTELGVPSRYHRPPGRDPMRTQVTGWANGDQIRVVLDCKQFGDTPRSGVFCAGGVATAKQDAITVLSPFSKRAVTARDSATLLRWDDLDERRAPDKLIVPPMPMRQGVERAVRLATEQGLPRAIIEPGCYEDEIATAQRYAESDLPGAHLIVAVPGGLARAGIGDFGSAADHASARA